MTLPADEQAAFDAWLYEQEGYALRAERMEFNLEWLMAAFAAGMSAERERQEARKTDEGKERCWR